CARAGQLFFDYW
nr:immunoglobulin heavy chain junction region [Mus musculus]